MLTSYKYLSTKLPQFPELEARKVKVAVPVTTDVEALAREVRPDVVIQYAESIFPYLVNFEKVGCLRVMWFLSNPQQTVTDIPVRNFIAEGKADLVIKSVDKLDRLPFSRELKDLSVKVAWSPNSVDGERFTNLKLEKTFDAADIGNFNPNNYYLRVHIHNFFKNQKALRYVCENIYGNQYVEVINRTKIFFTCTGKHRFPIMKFYEVPCCGTLLASDEPVDAEPLGFKSGENYVGLEKAWHPNVSEPQYPNVASEWAFDQKEFGDLLTYYLNSAEERERIARNGMELVRDRHTDEIRAKELYGMLKAV